MERIIPSQLDNPHGLHKKYVIKEIVSNPDYNPDGDYECQRALLKEVPVPAHAEYFVLRLDEMQKDKMHLAACRIGINAYADAISNHLPQLSKDLKERYPLI